MKYIAQLTEGGAYQRDLSVQKKQSALTKAGKPYESLMLQDKTGNAGRQDLGSGFSGHRRF